MSLKRRQLAPPRPPRETKRRRQHPALRALKELEHRTSQVLISRVLPHVPGLERIYGWQLRRSTELVTGQVALRGLQAQQAGLRVLALSDPHCGAFVGAKDLESLLGKLSEELEDTPPDLILFLGDFISGRATQLQPYRSCFELLGKQLKPRLGSWAVLGNHDHYEGEQETIAAMIESWGLEVLHDRHVVLGDGALVLAGIDDLVRGTPNLERALAGAPPGVPILLASHNPDVFLRAARLGVDLVLSGHTHGGQLRLPGLPPPLTMSRYRLSDGHYLYRGGQLVIGHGLGAVGVPLRVGCPPQAVLLTLVNEPNPRKADNR